MNAYREERPPLGTIQHSYHCELQEFPGKFHGVSPHLHEYFEILYCIHGAFQLRLNEKPYLLSVGDMALIDPFEVHVTQSLDPGENSYIVIKFVPEILYTAEQPIYEMKCLLPYLRMGAAHQKIFSVRELEANQMNRTVMEIYEEYRSKSFGYELAIRTAISRLFLCILRQWHAQNSSIGTDMEGPTLVLLQKAFDFIEANYHQEIGLKEAAEQCCMSYTAFSRFFSKYTRKGFAEYLLAVRLKKATVLLAATQKPITEIALETGFTTTSYFIQRFRLAYATTPLRYRKQFALAEAHSFPSTPSIVKVRE